MGAAADKLVDRWAPLAAVDPTDTEALEALAAAAAAPAQLLADVFWDHDGIPATESLLDPTETPAVLLPWLALFPGVDLPPGSDEATQRELVAEAAGLNRSQTGAIQSAVARTLTGTKSVTVLRQVSGARWAMSVITRTSETPDAVAAEAAARSQKPTGVVLTFLTSNAPFVDEGTRTIDAATGNIDTAVLSDVT